MGIEICADSFWKNRLVETIFLKIIPGGKCIEINTSNGRIKPPESFSKNSLLYHYKEATPGEINNLKEVFKI